ncbi:peptide ABC transporter substrate-binding protein [Roseiterribacter gracilis]|uniref:ABC transporter substrate-binding protein n=1 Tax=Roseiterribacter gracilis TaxID=2812848 RepID=A0A8S8XEF8_9PROT|nr:ABC transporter substrate-binding protein [Rhodospirillales bacterium TMPK1]
MDRRLIASAFAFAACTFLLVASPAHAARTQLTIGVNQFPSNFHPMVESGVAKQFVQGLVLRRLTIYGYDWTLECQLCTEIPTAENGRVKPVTLPDGRTARAVSFTLKPDIFWSDGTQVTSKDFVFAWNWGKDPQSGIVNYNLVSNDIVSVEYKDDRNFVITRTQTLCNPAEFGDFVPLPAHVERPIWEKSKADYRNRSAYDADPTRAGLHDGPYKIAKVERGSTIVFERNPYWKGQKPQFDRIIIKAIENTAALEANLKAGDIDFISGENGMSFDQAVSFQKRNADRFDIEFKSMLMWEFVNVNVDDPVLRDIRVRRALMHGLDRVAISKQIFEGRQSIADTMYHPQEPIYTEEGVAKYEFDRAKAIALLTEAGYGKVGADGIRVNDKGDRLSFELGTTAGNKTRELVQQVMQRMWREVGIEIRLKTAPARVMFGEILRRRQFPHMYMMAFAAWPANNPETILGSRSVPAESNGWSGQNYGGYRSTAMDAAIERSQTQCEPADQKKNWGDIQRLYAADLPQLPLFFRINTQVTPKWLHGVTQTGHQYASTWWVERWTAD